MARTLPWLSGGTTNTLKPAHSRPAKRQRVLGPNSDSDDNAIPRAVANSKKQAAPTAERTPSTSPPPQPPTEEFMRPGLSADDIYIMVEDEFHAIAQTFTKHLHHAEYVRLRKAAKERNASAFGNTSRPVDTTTTMREETRMRKEAEAREGRIAAAIGSIKGPERAKGLLDESDVSDFEDDRQDDPWQGTQLQRFMTTSPKRALPGLTGLQGAASHTRAAAGYPKPKKRQSQATKLSESARANAGAAKTVTIAQDPSASLSDTDDDDLDAPSRIPSRPPAHITPKRTNATKSLPKPTNHTLSYQVPKAKPSPSPPTKPSQRHFSLIPPRIAPTPKPPKKATPPDPSPTIRHTTTTESRPSITEVRQRLQARHDRQKRKASGGIGVDEIPIFLV